MDQPVTPVPVGFKDRRGALIGVGILVVAVGCVLALFTALLGLTTLLGPETGTATPPSRIWPGVVMYALLAVVFVWLGIGSMKARRWARALLLIISWLWLLTGIVGVAGLAVVLPKTLALQPSGTARLSEGCAGALVAVTLVVMVLFFVLLPGILVLFYRSPHVKATCDARDPVARWTDACPPQVLAISLMLALGAVSMLVLVVPYHNVVPVFGRLVGGIPGGAITVAMAALMAYCAWAVYRLEAKGWWIVLLSSAVGTTSAALTFARIDLLEMYRLMGYSPAELAQLGPFVGSFGRFMFPLMVANALLWFGYLLFMKKYFRPVRSESEDGSGEAPVA